MFHDEVQTGTKRVRAAGGQEHWSLPEVWTYHTTNILIIDLICGHEKTLLTRDNERGNKY